MSLTILERNDNNHLLKSYLQVYKINKLYKIKTDFRKIILRVVKKSILGTNFIYFYSKHGLFISAIINLIIINLNFILFPQLLYNSKAYINNPEDSENIIDNNSNMFFNASKLFNFNRTTQIIFRLFIINLLDLIVFSVIIFNYKYKQKKINRYMNKYTQCAIDSENELIKNKYRCILSEDGKFNLNIYSKKNKNIKNNDNMNDITLYNKINKDKYFFEYVINIPNIRFISNFLYKKAFLPKEKEIINKVIGISNEIEFKYKKKLLMFLLIIIGIIIYVPLMNIFAEEKRKDFINYFGILALLLFVERNNFFNNKSEQIQRVSLLSKEYINFGYYIYINNDIIIIFFVKEQFRNIESIDKIKKLNEVLLHEFELI
jgi:hypothetical protein